MSAWMDVIILAVIEGITEFLPISSTGHMLLAQHWMATKQSELFLAVVQSGAVLSVLFAFPERVKLLVGRWRGEEARTYWLKLGAAFGLTAAGGLILKKLGFELPEDPIPVAGALLVGGIAILVVEAMCKKRQLADDVTWKVVVAIGLGQLLAVIFPGLSRSGSTIMIALAMGTGRRAATEFSFLLGIPTLLAAGGLEVVSAIRHPEEVGEVHWGLIFMGTAIAAVTAFAAVKWLMRFIQTHTFTGFGYYRIALGVALLLVLKNS